MRTMFAIKLVRSLFYVIVLKIIGFTVLFFLYFSPEHRTKVDSNVIFEDVFHSKTTAKEK
ncbi:MAG: hypothetical protein FWE18_00370 [Alphaproteobacteria bacterium]|nr:hypothetical protein [Alphaproteobacteria bacterium]